MTSTSEDNVAFLMEHRDSFIHESEQLLYQRVLELCIAQTFAKIRVESNAIDRSQDTEENKKSKKNRLMGMAQWGLKMQKDLDNMKTGKTFDETNETTRLIVGKEVDKLLKSYTFPEMLHTITSQLAVAKDIINKNDH